jgi:predicted metalloendopeptidase
VQLQPLKLHLRVIRSLPRYVIPGIATTIFVLELTETQYLYTTATVEEAAEKAPALVLDKVISALAPEDYKLDRMIFQNQDVFVNVSSIVSNTPKSTLQALMMVMVYNSFAPYVSGSIVSCRSLLWYELSNPTQTADTDRWPFCYQYIDDSMPWIAGKFFVDATYSDEKRDLVKTMAEELRSAFGERVKEKHWFSDETKALIEEKISEIILKIGYPDHVCTPSLRWLVYRYVY